jgi:hypothetical protein
MIDMAPTMYREAYLKSAKLTSSDGRKIFRIDRARTPRERAASNHMNPQDRPKQNAARRIEIAAPKEEPTTINLVFL